MTDIVPITEQTLPGNRLQLSVPGCSVIYERVRPGVLLVSISGNDKGDFGTRVLDEIRLELLRHHPLELLVDASAVVGVALSVSNEWTQFFALNRATLKRVSVLVGSKAVELTVAIAQHLSDTGRLVQIYSDPAVFAAYLESVKSKGPD